jgi:hypothetical protein
VNQRQLKGGIQELELHSSSKLSLFSKIQFIQPLHLSYCFLTTCTSHSTSSPECLSKYLSTNTSIGSISPNFRLVSLMTRHKYSTNTFIILCLHADLLSTLCAFHSNSKTRPGCRHFLRRVHLIISISSIIIVVILLCQCRDFHIFLRRFNGIQDNIQTSLLLRESSGIIVAGSACLDFLAFDGRSDLFSGGII